MNQQRENCPQLAPWKYSCRLGSGISAMVLSIPAQATHQPGLTLPAPELWPRSCSYYTDGARMLLKILTIDSLVQGRPENSAGLGQGQVFGGNSAAGPSWREGPTAELLPKNEAVAVAFFFFFSFSAACGSACTHRAAIRGFGSTSAVGPSLAALKDLPPKTRSE